MDFLEPPNIYINEFIVDFKFNDSSDVVSAITIDGFLYDFKYSSEEST